MSGQVCLCFARLHLRPGSRPYELLDLCLRALPSGREDGFVDIGCHLLAQSDVEQLPKLLRHLLRLEDHERHRVLECALIVDVCRRTWGELFGGELDGGQEVLRRNILRRRIIGEDTTNNLDELQLEELKVQERVVVEDLSNSCVSARSKHGKRWIKKYLCMQIILRTEV